MAHLAIFKGEGESAVSPTDRPQAWYPHEGGGGQRRDADIPVWVREERDVVDDALLHGEEDASIKVPGKPAILGILMHNLSPPAQDKDEHPLDETLAASTSPCPPPTFRFTPSPRLSRLPGASARGVGGCPLLDDVSEVG